MELRVLEDIERVSFELIPNSTLSKLVTSFKNVPTSVGSTSLIIARNERTRTLLSERPHTIFLVAFLRAFCHGLVPFGRGNPKMRGSRGHWDYRGPKGALQPLRPASANSQCGRLLVRHRLDTYNCDGHPGGGEYWFGSSPPGLYTCISGATTA